jgi:TPR repeat protein
MLPVRRGEPRLSGLCALVFSGFFLLTASGFAATSAEPDLPNAQTAPDPRTVDEEIGLAADYLAGHGVAQDAKLAAYWYTRAAQAGDPEAALQTGYLYDAGIGVEKNPVLAVHWYQLAVAGGLARAKVNLAVAYLWGSGVEKNQAEAIRLLNEAAASGVGLAACYLGVIYQYGIGVPADGASADWWYGRGVKLHDARAEYDLGTLEFVGRNHAHNLTAAANLLRASSVQGYVPAMHSLGLLLVRNPKLAKSADEAVVLLNGAANAGVWRSHVLLGVLARDGAGVPPDQSAAYLHFRIAALEGGDEARQLLAFDLRILSAKLGAGPVKALDAQAEDWRRHHPEVLEFVEKDGGHRERFPAVALAVPEMGAHVAQLLPALPD